MGALVALKHPQIAVGVANCSEQESVGDARTLRRGEQVDRVQFQRRQSIGVASRTGMCPTDDVASSIDHQPVVATVVHIGANSLSGIGQSSLMSFENRLVDHPGVGMTPRRQPQRCDRLSVVVRRLTHLESATD